VSLPVPQVVQRLSHVARTLESTFLGKSETVRLMLVAAVAGEHMLLIGPPGTAKSAIVRMFAKLVDARYFEYLLTRFTEPNEIFGPIDIQAFRSGSYQRRMEGMLPTGEIVFLDEVFKANSAILNLDSYHFQDLLVRGLAHEAAKITGDYERMAPQLAGTDLRSLHQTFGERMRNIPEGFLAQYKGLVFQIRAEGVSVSDRRAVKMLKLFCASSLLDGRATPDPSDFFLLKHIWNNLDQSEILDGIVGPVLEQWYREHPEARRVTATDVGIDALIGEVNRIRDLLTGDRPLSDIQLFSQLKALQEIKAALQSMGTRPAQEAIGRVDQLLGHVYASGKFSQ